MNTAKKIGIIAVMAVIAGTSFLFAEGVQEIQSPSSAQPAADETTVASDDHGVTYMREEEKLARDVYLALFDIWGIRTFENIAQAEQQHMDSVAYLMDQQGIEDTVAYAAPGEFTIPAIKDLYNSLVEQGSKSAIDALKVGTLIEDLDIADLEEYLAGTTDPLTIQVYERLIAGSEQHMRAFMNQLAMYGETYEAQFISQERMDDILGSSMGMGGPSNQRGGHHGGRN